MDQVGISIELAAAMLGDMAKPQPVFWRLYYDHNGHPINYSMEDLPGTYIEIDAETYCIGSMNVRVVDGKLRRIQHNWSQKLVPSHIGTPCHVHDVAVVTSNQNAQYWNKKLYESYID